MKNIFIVKLKHAKRSTSWVIENVRTKKQAFKQFKYLSGFHLLTFRDFLKSFIVYKY